MSRRRFLRTAAKAGVSAELASNLSVEDFKSVDEHEVPIVYGIVVNTNTRPWSITRRKRAVPEEWYEQLEYGFSVQSEVFKRDITGVLGSFVVPGSFSDPEVSLNVDVTGSDVRDRVLDLLSDISFDISTIEDIPGRNDTNDYGEPQRVDDIEEKNVPGGVRCATEQGKGSLAPAMYDLNEQSAFFTTSNHLYGGSGADHRGEPLYLTDGDERRRIGSVDTGYSSEDFVRVEPENDYKPASEIRNADPPKIIGQFTKYGLADLQARGQELRKIGSTTGFTSGQIHGVDGVTCYYGDICKRGQLKWGTEGDMADGDSGSVTYRPDPEHPNDFSLVAGFNNARTWWPGADFVWGTAAYRLSDKYDYYF